MAYFIVSDHAVKRYRQRIAQRLTLDQVQSYLNKHAPTSALIREMCSGKYQLRVLSNPDCQLICARNGHELTVVTVLEPLDVETTKSLDDVLTSFDKRHAEKAVNVAVQKPIPVITKEKQREHITNVVASEIGKRMAKFLDEAKKQREHDMALTQRRAELNKEKLRIAEARAQAISDELRASQLGTENAAYRAMLRECIPMLQKLAATDNDAAAMIAKINGRMSNVASCCAEPDCVIGFSA